ncbi:hypothetical protein [Microbulbifer elongatus]|uniref:hypothetical protein n=1 Tax=Microbulbifer elongatus TaxID=86173 RepID=UPI001CFEF49F|nr:hypothetical protein [Microbulbifer elongatus]
MQFSLSQLAGAIITSATLASGVVVYIKSEQVNLLKDQISAFKSLNDVGLESLAKDAAIATSELKETLSKLQERKSLIERISKQEETIQNLESNSESQENRIKMLESQTNSMFSSNSSFSLKDKEHVKLFDAKYVLAVRKVQGEDVYLSLNNEMKFLRPGDYLELTNNEIPCKLFLESLKKWDVAEFSLLCKKI